MTMNMRPTVAGSFACAAGFGLLVLEIGGARLLAGTYGLSSIPWTAVIAVVLTGGAAGNLLGGLAADRWPPSLAYLFLGAALLTLVPLLGGALPALFLAKYGFVVGSVLSAAALLLAPSAVIGAITPVLVAHRVAHVDEAGQAFGSVSAWSTAGAVAGTVATGFIWLPMLSMDMLLALLASFFCACASVAAALEGGRRRVFLGLVLIPVPLILGGRSSHDPETIYAGQSAHAALRVVDRAWFGDVPVRELWQNGSLSSAEHRVTGEPTQFYKVVLTWMLADRLGRGSLLLLGGAANTLPSQLKRAHPELRITVVEVDALAVRIARQFFSFGRFAPGVIPVVVADARPFLRRDGAQYDVIVVDAYDQLYSVPWPLVTREAFAEINARLNDGGLMTITLSTPLDGPGAVFLRRLVATLHTVFSAVRAYPTRPELDPRSTQEVIVTAAAEPDHLPRLRWPWLAVPAAGEPLRDDYAPVEFLQSVQFLHDPAW